MLRVYHNIRPAVWRGAKTNPGGKEKITPGSVTAAGRICQTNFRARRAHPPSLGPPGAIHEIAFPVL